MKKHSKNIDFIDFCSGIGAGRLGLELLGFNCVAHSEINSESDYTYNQFFNDFNNLGDLTKIKKNLIPDCRVLIAGFPCQTFSIVGKRTGFYDERGQIIYSLSETLKEKKIPYFIFENVKGLVNHDKGNSIKQIEEILQDSGYVVDYKVLNSVNFGVPQLRERVYFVGIRRDLYYKPFEFPSKDIKSNLKDFLITNNNEILEITNTTFQKYLNNKYNKDKFDINEILKKDYTVIDTRQSDLRLYENKCPTLRTGRHGILYVKNKCLYKLSGLEALLLQGFPIEFALKAKGNVFNSKLLSQAGNAMTVNVIKAIGEQLLNYIEGENLIEFSRKRLSDCEERIQERA